MPKRPSNKGKDANQLAAMIVSQSTGQPIPVVREKNPAAVALGLLGGSKGGKIRAKNLSAKRRKEIASKAAKVRWKKKD